MRKLIAIFITILLLASCATVQNGGRGASLRETRDSVYKVKVTVTIDLTPLNEWRAKKAEERRKREEEKKKWWPRLWGHTVFINDVAVSMNRSQEAMDFHVIKTSDDVAVIGWSGTGWVAATAPGRSYIMTAGHVCESNELYEIEVFNFNLDTGEGEVETLYLPIIEKMHVMLSRDGVESASGNVIRDEDLDAAYNGNDLCMIGVTGDLGPAIPVASEDPEYGETCQVVGAPTGLWGGGIAVASDAKYSGRGSVFETTPDGLAFNGLLAPGNSGSAVVCKGKAVGVISLGATRFKSLTHAVPHESIREFMQAALHKK